MEGAPGQRPGSQVFQHEDGFLYHVDVRYLEGRWICSQRSTDARCPVMLILHDDGRFEIVGIHTHVAPERAPERRIFINALKQRALQVPGLVQAYEDVCRRYPNLIDLISRGAALAHIRNERKRNQPDVPDNMGDLGNMLFNNRLAAGILQDHIQAGDGSFITIFASNQMINRLNTATELHLSGTNDSITNVPARQLMTLFFRKKTLGVPAIYILFERHTVAAYAALWRFILRKAPAVRNNLHTAVCDCDDILVASLRENMGWIGIRFSLFHFVKIVTRKWYNLGLPKHNPPNGQRLWAEPPAVLKVLHLAWSMPLVEDGRIEEAVNEIETYSRQFENTHEMILVFVRHLRQWQQHKTMISIKGIPARNHDITEAFARHTLRLLGDQGILTFIDKLSNVITKIESNWINIATEQPVPEPVKILLRQPKQTLHNKQINLQQACLSTRRLTMLNFLKSAIPPAMLQDFPLFIYRPAHRDDFVNGIPSFNLPDWDLLNDPDHMIPEPPPDVVIALRRNPQPRVAIQPQPLANEPQQRGANRRPARGRPPARGRRQPYPVRNNRRFFQNAPAPPLPAGPAVNIQVQAPLEPEDNAPVQAPGEPAEQVFPDQAHAAPAAPGLAEPAEHDLVERAEPVFPNLLAPIAQPAAQQLPEFAAQPPPVNVPVQAPGEPAEQVFPAAQDPAEPAEHDLVEPAEPVFPNLIAPIALQPAAQQPPEFAAQPPPVNVLVQAPGEPAEPVFPAAQDPAEPAEYDLVELAEPALPGLPAQGPPLPAAQHPPLAEHAPAEAPGELAGQVVIGQARPPPVPAVQIPADPIADQAVPVQAEPRILDDAILMLNDGRWEMPNNPDFWQDVPPPNPIQFYRVLNQVRFDDQLVDDMDRPPTCVVCMENVPKVMLLPCKHLAFCLQCNARDDDIKAQSTARDALYSHECPVDRRKIAGKITLFYP